MSLPAVGAFDVGVQTKAEISASLEAQLAAIKQLPGAAAVSELTITSGTIQPVNAVHYIAPESGDTDDLTNILQAYIPDGHVLVLSHNDTDREITVKHAAGGIGMIYLKSQEDLALGYMDTIVLVRHGTLWEELLRSWDPADEDAQDTQISVANWFLCQAFGGGADGVIAYGTVLFNACSVTATSPTESMAVTVAAGAGFCASVPFRRESGGNSAAMTVPVSNPRIDTVAVVAATGAISIHTGTENVSPVAPSIDSGEVRLAYIHHVVGETAIYDSEITGEGYIEDARVFLNS